MTTGRRTGTPLNNKLRFSPRGSLVFVGDGEFPAHPGITGRGVTNQESAPEGAMEQSMTRKRIPSR